VRIAEKKSIRKLELIVFLLLSYILPGFDTLILPKMMPTSLLCHIERIPLKFIIGGLLFLLVKTCNDPEKGLDDSISLRQQAKASLISPSNFEMMRIYPFSITDYIASFFLDQCLCRINHSTQSFKKVWGQ